MILVLCSVFLLSGTVNGQNADLITEKHQAPFGNLDKTPYLGNVVYSRQPDAATIAMLKDQGFKMVLSVRYDDEPVGFDARKLIEKNGISFVQISYLKGSINDKERSVDDDAVTQIKQVIEAANAANSKILLHCASGQRAAATLGSILYRDYGFSQQEARKYVEKAGLTSKGTGAIYDKYISSIKK
jgi:protein tyrosine phosphatase (PTP) superfamily phosphohydrolase (DUF442 family)